jgi:hypothetical protein
MRVAASVPLLLLAGCPGAGFDWRGDEASATVAWTLDGDPLAAGTCARHGAARARLVVGWAGGRFLDRDLEWPCEAASGLTGLRFRAATFRLALELIDPDGRVVAASDWRDETFLPGANVPEAFALAARFAGPDADLDVVWTLDGAPADAATCASAGAAAVRLEWRLAGAEGPAAERPCADGGGRVEAWVPSGVPVDLRLALLDADGFAVAVSPWRIDLRLEPGANALAPFDLVPAGGRGPLAAILWWAGPPEMPVYLSCGEAGVAGVGYRLRDVRGAVVDAVPWETAPVPCAGILAWSSVPYGEYALEVDGLDADGARLWSAECWGLRADDPGDNTYECLVPRVP